MSANEMFRNEFVTKLFDLLPQDQVKAVMNVFDITSYGYEIEQKKMELITVDGTPEIVKRYLASKAIAGLSFKSIYQYKTALITFFTSVQKTYSNIKPDDIRMYLNYYLFQLKRSKGYVDQIRIKLHGFFQWLVDNEYIVRNPCAVVEKIKYNKVKQKPFTPLQLAEVKWDAIQIDIRTRAVIDFLFSTGMRVGEIAQVKKEDIDWQNRSVIIRHGKGDKERVVYFNAESELTLKKYLTSRNDDNEYLFVSKKKPHNPIKERSFEKMLARVGEISQIHVHPHKFRRSFATTSINAGMQLQTLQALLGHSETKTTMIYVDMCQQNIQHEHHRIYA